MSAAAVAADDRKSLIKSLKRERVHLTHAIDNIIATHLALKELGPHAEEDASKAKAKPKAKAVPKKAKVAEVVEAPKADTEPFICAGNVLTGKGCVGGEGSNVRAADTRHEKHAHQTCKVCKKLINKTRAEQRASAAPAAGAAAAADDEEGLVVEREVE